MLSARRFLNRVPALKRVAKSLYSIAAGLPQVTYGEVTDDQLRSLIGRPDPVIVEVGCNDGEQTLRFREVFQDATIYCFEPDPRAAARFRRNVGNAPNVQLFEMAI